MTQDSGVLKLMTSGFVAWLEVGSWLSAAQSVEGEVVQGLVGEKRGVWPCPFVARKADTK